MDDNSANVELLFILAAMVALLLFGVAAVLVFLRVWRKERRK